MVQWLKASGSPGFNSATLCKEPTSCLLTFGVLNYITVKFKLFLKKSGLPVN